MIISTYTGTGGGVSFRTQPLLLRRPSERTHTLNHGDRTQRIEADTVFTRPGIPVSVKGQKFKMSREFLSSLAGQVATVEIEVSFDNQASWILWKTFKISGGDVFKDGVLQAESWSAFTWPGENDGSGGRREILGTDVRVTIKPAQSYDAVNKIEEL